VPSVGVGVLLCASPHPASQSLLGTVVTGATATRLEKIIVLEIVMNHILLTTWHAHCPRVSRRPLQLTAKTTSTTASTPPGRPSVRWLRFPPER
jgi:hypothetical protein